MGEDMAILHNIFGNRGEEVVRYGDHQYESLSTRMEERDRCFAIDTQPNDHPFLVRYVEQNTVNQEYVPDLHHQVALLQNGCSVEGQDNAALMRSTQVVDEATLLQNGCCVEGQDNATSLRSVEVVKEASLESEDDTTLSRSVEVVKGAALEQNECCMEGEDNATSSRSVEVVKEVALLQNECCVEVEDAPLLLRSAEAVEGDEEANASELIEIDKEQFCQNLNTRKGNPRAMIRTDKDYFNQETSCGRENLCESVDPLKRKARTADVDEGDHGIIKRAFVRIDSRQLCRSLMRPGKDRLATNHNKVQILVPIYNEANQIMTKKKTYDYQNQDVGVELSEKHDVKEEPNPSIRTTHQCAECSTTFKMTGGRHLEERDTFKMIGGRHHEERDEGSEMTHSVQILDIAPLVEKGFVSPFVSSKKFHITVRTPCFLARVCVCVRVVHDSSA